MRNLIVAVLLLGAGLAPALADGSFVLGDGTNRAPAVALHCVGSNGVALPCGGAASPLSVTAPSGIPSVPIGGTPTSRSTSLPATQSTTLFPANANRRFVAFQVPQSGGVWVNFLGGVAAPNGADCAFFVAGSLYESGQWVNRGVITVYAPVATAITAWEN